MKKAKYYHNPRCSKSRIGLSLLEEKNTSFEVIEYLKVGLTKKELTDIFKKLEGDKKKLIRVKESEYKESKLDISSASDDDLIKALVDYPKLLERPLLVTDKKAVIGRPPEDLLTIL